MIKRYRLLPVWILGAAMLVVAGCGPATTEVATQPPSAPTEAEVPTATAPVQEEPIVLRVGGLLDADCWNPYTCASYWFFGHIVSEGFTDHGPSTQGCDGIPRLAKSWEVSEDGLTWTIHLYEGITFHDGTPGTAQKFADFMSWLASSETLKYWYPEALYLESVEAIDDVTLRYTTSTPVINSPDLDWIWWYMLNPKIWSELDESEILTYENMPPIGTGPFYLKEHVPGSYMIFDAWEKYHLGKPAIDRVVYQVYTNADALVSAIMGGEIDLTTAWMPPETYDALAAAPNIAIEEKAPGVWHELIFNMYPQGKRHPAMADPAVREAIDYAIDKQYLVNVVLLGHGLTCPTNWGCGPNYEKESNPDLLVTPFDLDKANEILDKAGYPDTDGDGIRESPQGEPLQFRLAIQSEVPAHLAMAEQLGKWWKDIGIAIEIEAQEYGTWYDSILDQRDFDMAIDGEAHDIDAASMDYWYSCWAADAGSTTLNFPGYCNEEMDALVYEFWYSTDLQARWEPMFEAQRILNQDRPIINLAGQNSIQAYRTDRFEFPLDTCYVDFGMFSGQGLLNTVPK